MKLQSGEARVTVRDGGAIEVLDRKSGAVWNLHLGAIRLRTVTGSVIEVNASDLTARKKKGRILLTTPPGVETEFGIAFALARNALTIKCKPARGVVLDRVELARDSLAVGATQKGYALVPAREGLLIPADSGKVFSRRFGTYEYEGCHLAMLGLVKAGSALLVSWDDPYVNPTLYSKGGRLSIDLILERSSSNVTLSLLGTGGTGEIARAYRKVAQKRGLVVTLKDKIRNEQRAGKLVGASNVKLWHTFIRNIDPEGTETGSRLNWTFTECAAIAEHLKHDLKIDRVLFMIGGWIKRGYDNQHPDILPANAECGGDRRLTELAKRVKKLGYLFCLHDNYQDIYRDSPSWKEDYIMRNSDGSLRKGGVWAGGQAWLTCSPKALELARRPQNLPAVRRLFRPDSYFIDTTYAAGLMECHNPDHPLTKLDDMRYKQDLSDYARGIFGVFGSECGREWAIPHADFFEGITGVSGRGYHDAGLIESVGAVEIPLFEMIFRDCVAAWGKYGYDTSSAAPYVLRHILLGRPLNYHSLGQHLYWKGDGDVQASPSIASFKATGSRSFDIAYGWTVTGDVRKNWRIFVHFAGQEKKADRETISFQNDHAPPKPTSEWRKGEYVRTPAMRVRVPAGKSGAFDVLIGMWDHANGDRPALRGNLTGNRRYLIGRIKVGKDGIRLLPPGHDAKHGLSCFSGALGGWAEGMCPTDVFIKNTHEVLSPLHELTAHALVTDFEFLTHDQTVRRARFGDGTYAIVNYGSESYPDRDTGTVLPQFGFMIMSEKFMAFHASKFNGLEYDSPVLFTVRSLDSQPLKKAVKVRVFHGFGDPHISLNGRTHEVAREAVLRL